MIRTSLKVAKILELKSTFGHAQYKTWALMNPKSFVLPLFQNKPLTFGIS